MNSSAIVCGAKLTLDDLEIHRGAIELREIPLKLSQMVWQVVVQRCRFFAAMSCLEQTKGV